MASRVAGFRLTPLCSNTGSFDWSLQADATAFVPPPQPPANVWMRPPLMVSFTYTPPNDAPYSFTVYVSHTKPAFGAGGPPAGTPADALNNQSVFYELWATENNQVAEPPATENIVVLGDLNSDCASYPQRERGTNFKPAVWGHQLRHRAG